MKKISQYITLITVLASLAIGLFSVEKQYSAATIAFLLWTVSPYILLSMLINLVSGKAAIITALIITLLTCLTGLAFLIDALYIHNDAQSSLAFSAVPLWQWAALIILSIPLTLFNIIENSKNKKPLS